jgi:1-aminocyclopropane-1-carboxylate deaminase
MIELMHTSLASHQIHAKTVVTAGGPFSNHLAATAAFCQKHQMECFGIIRGESNAKKSHTLAFCESKGMKLTYVDRTTYGLLNAHSAAQLLPIRNDKLIFIPAGGFDPLGVEGAMIMAEKVMKENPTHIIMSMGTGTTIAGCIKKAPAATTIIGVSALKGMNDWKERWDFLLQNQAYHIPTIWNDEHEGGYAKYNPQLLDFMNSFYLETGITTDFVYTGKMMKAVYHQLSLQYFKKNSKIICIHTGGLQGNLSLTSDSLTF